MNILIIHEIDWIEKVIFEPHHLAELFSIKGNNVFVIDCRTPSMKFFFEGFRTKVLSNYNRVYDDASITLIRPPSILIKGLNRFSSYFCYSKIIKNIVTEKKIDVIFLYGVATNGVQTIRVAKELNVPVIFRVLDVAHALIKIPIVKQLAKRNEKFVIKNSNKVLTTTKNLVEYAVEMGAKRENVAYFPLGVNCKVFKPIEKDWAIAKKLGINENDKIILFMGTIYHFSGVDEIINNFNFLKNKIPNLKFIVIGGGEWFYKIKDIIRQKNLSRDVILVGFLHQNKIPQYLSLADLCLNPFKTNTITERIIPVKILEYLACKKPVLSTPLKGTIELLPDDNYGIVYSPLINYSEMIVNLLSNSIYLKKIAENGYKIIQQLFDWELLSGELLNEFKYIVDKKVLTDNF